MLSVTHSGALLISGEHSISAQRYFEFFDCINHYDNRKTLALLQSATEQRNRLQEKKALKITEIGNTKRVFQNTAALTHYIVLPWLKFALSLRNAVKVS